MGYITHTRCQLHNILYVLFYTVHTYIAPHGEVWGEAVGRRTQNWNIYEWMNEWKIQTDTMLPLKFYTYYEAIKGAFPVV